jgi:hypothetical protein
VFSAPIDATIEYMTLTISLPPDTEAKLRDQAKASGKDMGTFVREAVEEKLRAIGEPRPARDLSNEQWLIQFNAWMDDVAKRASVYPAGFIVDDSRESIYEDRGE